MPVESAYADDSSFPTVAKEGIDVENVSAADVAPGMSAVRHAPDEDELAQGGDAYPPGVRRGVVIHPAEMSDEPYFARNQSLRSAARDSGPMDPSYALVSNFGMETPDPGRSARGRNTDG